MEKSNNEIVTLASGIHIWLKEYKSHSVKAATYDRLQTAYKALLRNKIRNVRVAAITADDIQTYLNDLSDQGYSISTIKKQFTLITAYLKYAMAKGILVHPSYLGVTLPKRKKYDLGEDSQETYDIFEQTKLLKVLGSLEKRQYGLAILMLEAGLRVGEAQALTWDDILWNKRAVRVNKTYVRLANERSMAFVQNGAKSDTSNRIVPLSNRAYSTLEKLASVATNRHGLIFPSENKPELPVSYSSIRFHLRKACDEAGVEYKGCHIFRHTFATNCYHRGCDVKILSKLLGHADVAITYNIYIHLYGDALEEMRKVID